MTNRKPRVELKNISKKFGSFSALNDVSMDVYPGEIHALLGDNGAGKTTLIKILSGIYPASSGEIFVEGKRAQFESPRDASEVGIGTVYQDLALNALTSVTRNFFLGRELTLGKRPFGLLKMNAPKTIPSTVPNPPLRTIPPITAAAIASSSFKFPLAASEVLVSNTWDAAKMVAQKAEKTKSEILTLLVGTPLALAALSSPPVE